jgi:uncharacterized protein YndB with AHSA1/START domain
LDVRRSRSVAAPLDDVWQIVRDPYHLPRWWPRVERVEGVTDRAFTVVLGTDKGRSVRADYRVVESRPAELRRWAQVVRDTPFERILAASETEVRLADEDGGTRVEVILRRRMRGTARLGGFMVRGAAGRQLDEALEALGTLHGG